MDAQPGGVLYLQSFFGSQIKIANIKADEVSFDSSSAVFIFCPFFTQCMIRGNGRKSVTELNENTRHQSDLAQG